MKELSFDCLPDQLHDWVRQSNTVPEGAIVDDSVASEVLFTVLFPKTRKYHVGYSPGSDSHSCETTETSIRSVDIQPRYRRVDGTVSLKILTVTIEDNHGNVQRLYDQLKSFGLLDGEARIDTQVALMAAELRNQSIRDRNIAIAWVFGLALIVFASMAALFYMLKRWNFGDA